MYKNYGLTKYQENNYSQYGEDGMIKQCLESIDISENGFFVDVGSWDGIYLSNVYNLIKNKNFSGICIEADDQKFNQLLDNMSNFNVKCLKSFISLEENDCIDYLLENNNCPINFDLISIDIDGNDWWIWNSLKKFRPKIVVIEYNSNIQESCIMPYDKNYIHYNTTFYGATPPALELLGEFKNYDLVGINGVNMFFIAKEFNKLPIISSKEYSWFMKWAGNDDRKMRLINSLEDIKNINDEKN